VANQLAKKIVTKLKINGIREDVKLLIVWESFFRSAIYNNNYELEIVVIKRVEMFQ